MHYKLGLPMTNCSLFFSSGNFEVKHTNTFGLEDADLATFVKLLEEDDKEEAESQIEATKLGQKHTVQANIWEADNPVKIEEEEESDEEQEGAAE